MLKQKVMFLWFRKWRFGEAKQSVQGHMARVGDLPPLLSSTCALCTLLFRV